MTTTMVTMTMKKRTSFLRYDDGDGPCPSLVFSNVCFFLTGGYIEEDLIRMLGEVKQLHNRQEYDQAIVLIQYIGVVMENPERPYWKHVFSIFEEWFGPVYYNLLVENGLGDNVKESKCVEDAQELNEQTTEKRKPYMLQALAQLSNEEYHKAVEVLTTTTPAEIETQLTPVDDISTSDDAVVTRVAVVSHRALFAPSGDPKLIEESPNAGDHPDQNTNEGAEDIGNSTPGAANDL